MSELKVFYSPDGEHTKSYYLKSEADKVIAERKEKYNELAKLYDKAIQACCDTDKVIAHHKYKRCFKMSRWCVSMMTFNSKYGTDKKWHHFKKWHERWLELAEKFKEAK